MSTREIATTILSGLNYDPAAFIEYSNPWGERGERNEETSIYLPEEGKERVGLDVNRYGDLYVVEVTMYFPGDHRGLFIYEAARSGAVDVTSARQAVIFALNAA